MTVSTGRGKEGGTAGENRWKGEREEKDGRRGGTRTKRRWKEKRRGKRGMK